MSIDYSNVGDYSRDWSYAIDNGYKDIISIIKCAIFINIIELCKKYDIELKR